MSIEEILDDMEQLLEKAGSVPFAQHKAIIDGERLSELINDIRLNMPQEIKHAKMVAFDRERIIKEAEAKAEQIVRQAEDRAKVIVSEEAIVREAKNRAVEVVTKAKGDCDALRAQANADVAKARAESEAIKQATDTYIVNRFKDAEAYYTNALKDVQERKAKLEKLKRRTRKPEGEQREAAPADPNRKD
ncbi:MAG: vacuolar-type H+-ATPase subunit H [Oscillospiraceae bacterium]|nr:vacuolar-type H+-ATPase subunit H [Oscillospiraceae bacterium]